MANGQLVSENNIQTTPPSWQHPVLPAPATQGNILITVNPFITPPEDSSNFKWLPMEDIIGTADIKMEYDDTRNEFNFYKAKGHLDNNGEWHYDWELFATVDGITPEAQQALQDLVYVSYEYDTTVANTLKVYGIKKSGQKVLLCDIEFVSVQVFEQAITNLTYLITAETTRAITRENELETAITAETTRATTRENELETAITAETTRATTREDELALNLALNGIATNVVQETTGKSINVRVDNDSIVVDNSNNLKSNIIDDTSTGNNKTLSAQKILALANTAFRYKGKVATMADLPSVGVAVGDTYKVEAIGNYYAWNGTTWDDLETDYIAGVGIDITNRVISATGVAFATGDGLQVQGSGQQAVLSVKAGDGLQFAQDKTMSVKAGNGLQFAQDSTMSVKAGNGLQFAQDKTMSVKAGDAIIINSNGVKVNNGTTIKIENNQLEVDYDKGLIISDENLKLMARINSTNLKFDNVGAIDTVLQTWTGTQAEYDALVTYDNNTIYMIHE